MAKANYNNDKHLFKPWDVKVMFKYHARQEMFWYNNFMCLFTLFNAQHNAIHTDMLGFYTNMLVGSYLKFLLLFLIKLSFSDTTVIEGGRERKHI